MNKGKIFIIGISVTILLAVSLQSVDGRTMEQVVSMVYSLESFKIFDDGVEYTTDCLTKKGYDCTIIHEGVEYPCEFNRMHGGMLTPMCVEIILRSMEIGE